MVCGQQRSDRRIGKDRGDMVVCALNFTPVPREGYRLGVPKPGFYSEVLNTDAALYGGGNIGNLGGVYSEPIPMHGHAQSILVRLPPLALIVMKPHGS